MEDEKLNYEELSDMDLIQRFCSDPPDQDAFRTCWTRYEQTIRKYTGHLAIMCPRSHSRDIFAEDVFDKTQEKVVRKICGFKAESCLSTWLYKIVQNTALELRRKIRGSSNKGPYVRVPVTDEELANDSAVFRDKLKRDPFHHAAMVELKRIVKRVLRDYTGSKEGHESYLVICLYEIDQCPVPEIAARRGTYERKIYRMLDHDYEALKASFTQAGLRSFLER